VVTIPPENVNSNTALSTGVLRLAGFWAPRTEDVTQVRMVTHTQAAAATPTLVRMGLYVANADFSSYALVASTPNDTTLFANAGTEYAKAFSARYTLLDGVHYLVGALVVTSTTAPTVACVITSTVGLNAAMVRGPIRAASLSGQTDLPATIAASALSVGTQVKIYAEVS